MTLGREPRHNDSYFSAATNKQTNKQTKNKDMRYLDPKTYVNELSNNSMEYIFFVKCGNNSDSSTGQYFSDFFPI